MLAAGCTSTPKAPPASAFKADDLSGKPKRAAQGWVAAGKDWSADKDLAAILALPENREIKDLLASPQCAEPAPKSSPASPASPSRTAGAASAGGSAFVVSGTRLVADLYADKEPGTPEQLKREAIDASNVDVSFSANGFRGVRCAVFARYAQGDAPTRPGLLAVLAIEQKLQDGKFTDYFRFRPLYIRATNTIAKTAAANGAQPAQIAVSFALVTRQLVVNGDGAAKFAELGSAATTIARVPLGGNGMPCTTAQCSGMSPPVPVPVARGTVVISMGVSEAGDVGAEIDQIRVEREAVAAARVPGTPAAAPAATPPAHGSPEHRAAR
ncbi:hypothetical protein CYJ10_08585 [Cupriavidus pauculus]|uniref:Uncharacterized protein n=2 Tax=Cupriavidus pauculus TaxID=82633 RepID=A0A2N5CEA9_9BURK|nr:hypothetical protein CYJ10_08585 [Cupriavidus pauculus]